MTETIGPIYTDLARQANALQEELNIMAERLSEARIAEIQARQVNTDGWVNGSLRHHADHEIVRDLLTELSALRGERDEARQQRDEERKWRFSLAQTLDDWRRQIRRLQGELDAADQHVKIAREGAEVEHLKFVALQGACEQLQWCAVDRSVRIGFCPFCGRHRTEGHNAVCTLAPLLTAPPAPLETKPGKIGESIGLSENLIVVPSETAEETK